MTHTLDLTIEHVSHVLASLRRDVLNTRDACSDAWEDDARIEAYDDLASGLSDLLRRCNTVAARHNGM